MKSFFNPENFLWQWFGRIADFLILSCMWVIGCMPVVTIGTASVALYDTAAHCIHGKERDMARRFLNTYKKEAGRGILMTLLWALIAPVLNAGYQIVVQATADTALSILGGVYFTLLLLPIGTACWVVAIESRFAHSFGQLHRNAILFTLGHLPQTLGIALLFVLALNILRAIPFLVMFIPGLTASLQALLIEKVFQKYTPATEE